MPEFTAKPPHEVNTTTAGDQVRPVVTTLPGGGHVVAWTSHASNSPSVMAQFYAASGAKAGGEVTLIAGYTLGGLAAMPDGTLVASLWQSSFNPSPQSATSFARFDPAGRSLAAPVIVNGAGDYELRLSAGQVFATADGGFALVETQTTRPVPWSTSTNIVRLFDATGASKGQFSAGENWMPALAVQETKGGGFVTVNQPFVGPSPSRIGWNVFDAQGNSTASATFTSTYGAPSYTTPTAVALEDGRAFIAWQLADYSSATTRSTWQGQWIDAQGRASGGVVEWAFAGTSGPRLTALESGGFVATWTAQADYYAPHELYGQYFDGAGRPASGTIHVATFGHGGSYGNSHTVAATSDGGFLVEYTQARDGLEIHQREFDVAGQGGSVPSGQIQVNGGVVNVPAGNYAILGSAGVDQIAFAGVHTQYTVTPTSVSGPEGVDTLSSIERVRFGDGMAVALDVNGDAGMAYRLYQAAFDRAPDLPGLGYHIKNLDSGVPLTTVAAHFIASPEFQSTYGSVDNTQFITLLYRNVLNREPEPAGLEFHLGEFSHGESRADMLSHFSESPENQANVIGQIVNGMLYVPLL